MKDEFKQAKPLEAIQAYYLHRRKVLTGSRAFGLAEPGSDVDYIVLSDHKVNRQSLLEAGAWAALAEYDGQTHTVLYCKLSTTKHPVNIILAKNKEVYNEWVFATKRMKSLVTDSEFKDRMKNKELRITTFRNLRKLYYELSDTKPISSFASKTGDVLDWMNPVDDDDLPY